MRKVKAVPIVEDPPKPRVFVVEFVDGSKSTIVLGAEDSLTFGPAIPAPPRSQGGFRGEVNEYALRVYKGSKEKGLRACWAGVRHFRELNIEVLPFGS